MNPVLPKQYYIPDVEARVWNDGRIYLYGSWDISGDSVYCSNRYHVFSSDDMENWTDHGRSFDLSRCHNKSVRKIFAPDCIYHDGQYMLLYCADDDSEGLALSNQPEGPFGQGRPIAGADGDGIDPAGLVDDDGSVYYFWGQFRLRGARLKDDLSGIDPKTYHPELLTEADSGFHEGACIRKRNDIYYLVYTDISRGKASCLGYATSTSPLGPYKKQGIIIDNMGCDPGTWNNHGSIAEFNNQWYVFYHRSSQGVNLNRRCCVEPIFFNDDGTIGEVEMTTQGAAEPLDATRPIEAWRACLFSGEKICSMPMELENGIEERLSLAHDRNWAAYKYITFPEGLETFRITLGSMLGGGVVEVRIDSPKGPLIASISVPETGGWRQWQTIEAPLSAPISGTHALYLVFRGGWSRICDVLDFHFA